MNNGFKWNELPKKFYPKPQGKLTRMHFVGSPEKLYYDERFQVFRIHFETKQKVYLYTTFSLNENN
jgi:hypothetical protein